MRRLAIAQPYVPNYRLAFFERLENRLRDIDVEMTVLAPLPAGDMARRGDAVTEAPWQIITRSRSMRLRHYQFTDLGSGKELDRFDAVIVPGAATYLDGYLALIRRGLNRRNFRVGWWGHIGSYVKRESSVDAFLEKLLMRRMDQVFAYTSGGAIAAMRRGVDNERVTIVQNTIDNHEVEKAYESLTPAEVGAFSQRYNLGSRTFTYLGGIDRDKGIGELSEALDALWRIDPATRVLVLGRGSDEHLLTRAEGRGQVFKLGYADARLKALAARVSEAFVQPGRVGLIAVDALVLQRPIITFRNAMHAPELDYLVEGTDVFFTPSEPAVLAAYLAGFKRDTDHQPSPAPTLGDMVDRYTEGVSRMMYR